MTATTDTTTTPAPTPADLKAGNTCTSCGKIVRNGKGHDPKCVHAGEPPAPRAARKPRAPKQTTAQPKAADAPAANQEAPAATPAEAPKEPKAPKRVIFAHVLPVRGKTAITEGRPPEGMLIIQSTENTPWEPGALRLLATQPGKPLPKGPFHLAHAKTGGWLAEWVVLETTDAKGLQVWAATEPAPAPAPVTTTTAAPAK